MTFFFSSHPLPPRWSAVAGTKERDGPAYGKGVVFPCRFRLCCAAVAPLYRRQQGLGVLGVFFFLLFFSPFATTDMCAAEVLLPCRCVDDGVSVGLFIWL